MKKSRPHFKTKIKRVVIAQCPFCASNDVEYDDLVVDGGTVSQLGSCLDCLREHYSIYTLTDVEEKI